MTVRRTRERGCPWLEIKISITQTNPRCIVISHVSPTPKSASPSPSLADDILSLPLLLDLRGHPSYCPSSCSDTRTKGRRRRREIFVPIKRSELRSIVPCALPPSDETAQRPFPALPLPFLARLTNTNPRSECLAS